MLIMSHFHIRPSQFVGHNLMCFFLNFIFTLNESVRRAQRSLHEGWQLCLNTPTLNTSIAFPQTLERLFKEQIYLIC